MTPSGRGVDSLGQRIACLRTQRGWTQADLAIRLAASRVAVSHFEMGLAIPSERTIVLLAGLFKLEPWALVDGTAYPAAKRERLPATACRYTEIELRLALLERDLAWLARLPASACNSVSVAETLNHWQTELETLRDCAHEPQERLLLREARRALEMASMGHSARVREALR